MNYYDMKNELELRFSPDGCFDIIKREINIGKEKATYFAVDGLIDSDVLERIIDFLVKCDSVESLLCRIPYPEVTYSDDIDTVSDSLLSGGFVLLCESRVGAVIIFARKYPSRSIEETENEKTLRGPRDSFTERLLINAALIRRRVKDSSLRAKKYSLGSVTKTDVALVYLENKVSRKLLCILDKKLNDYPGETLSFGEQTLSEYLIKSRWYNPFPKIRYTERPDSASAMIEEGSVILICDNSPAVMILPTSIFDFLHEANDFYLNPISATYLRFVRLFISVVTVTMMPTWYLFVKNPDLIPNWLQIISLHEHDFAVPVLVQIILVEIIIDGLKIASLNTPDSLGNSLSVVTGLILGDMAVKIGWFVPEVKLYMAFVSIANFSQPSYEMGYALKFMRIMILILTSLFNFAGYIIGNALVIVLILSNKTVDGSRSYLYPLIPWNRKAMKRFFVRQRLESSKLKKG